MALLETLNLNLARELLDKSYLKAFSEGQNKTIPVDK